MMNTDFSSSFSSSFKQFFSDNTQHSKRLRALSGLLMAVMLLPLLLGVLACIPTVPVGDPEKSRVDSALSGVWLPADDEDSPLMVLDPYDQRTWLVTWFYLEEAAPAESEHSEDPNPAGKNPSASVVELLRQEQIEIGGFGLFKGWLTPIEEKRFLTLEPKSYEPGSTPDVWYIFGVHLDGENRLHLGLLNYDLNGLDELETAAEAEEFIRLNLENPDLLDDPMLYFKASEDDLEMIHGLIDDYGYDLGF